MEEEAERPGGAAMILLKPKPRQRRLLLTPPKQTYRGNPVPDEKDLVTRLHWYETNVHSDSPVTTALQSIVSEAVAEIERLRAELKTCQEVRDSWCAEYTKLRDSALPLKTG
jgi:hypothetical protein